MSNSKEKLNETALNELMLVIRRNSQDSACIANFENLLHEIDSPVFVNATVNSMFNFLTEAFELFKTVDKVPQKKFKAKMLTTDFIEPMRFFGKVRRMANADMKVRAAIEMVLNEESKATVDSERQLINFGCEPFREAAKVINVAFRFTRVVDTQNGTKTLLDSKSFEEICESGLPQDKVAYLKELARKEMLVWNYIPAIVKAILQTKRRSLDMDKNSKRFK